MEVVLLGYWVYDLLHRLDGVIVQLVYVLTLLTNVARTLTFPVCMKFSARSTIEHSSTIGGDAGRIIFFKKILEIL
jgi:hypothetical protein